jgi:uncharacterized protein
MRGLANRNAVTEELGRLAQGGGPWPRLAVLAGRPGSGKTWVLDHAWRGRRVCHFVCAEVTATVNRRELVAALAGDPPSPASSAAGQRPARPLAAGAANAPSGWPDVVSRLAEAARAEPLVLVLDDCEHLLAADPDGPDGLVAALASAWHGELAGVRLTLVLAGTDLERLERLCDSDGPLGGRVAWSGLLEPLDYTGAGKLLPGRMPKDRALLYGVLGGTPRYVTAVRQEWSLAQAVQELVLSPRGDVHQQVAAAVGRDPAVRDRAEYHSVLLALARGAEETAEIARLAGLADRPHTARRILEILEQLGLVVRVRNFGAGGRSPWRSRLADPAVAFRYRFVHGHRAALARGRVREVWSAIASQLDGYMDDVVFPALVAQAYPRVHRRAGLPPATEWGDWAGRDRNGTPIRVPVVARLADGRLLTGATRWAQAPADTDMHVHLLRDLSALAAAGHGWAAEALDPDRSAGFVYFAAAGFTAHFRDRARRDGRIVLVDLEQLYSG